MAGPFMPATGALLAIGRTKATLIAEARRKTRRMLAQALVSGQGAIKDRVVRPVLDPNDGLTGMRGLSGKAASSGSQTQAPRPCRRVLTRWSRL